MTEPKSVWDVGAELGEGPVWVERDRALWFTDIKQRKVHRYDPASGARRSWDAPAQIGFLLPAQSGGFVAGLETGLFRFDEQSGVFALLAEVEPDLPGNRLNDAATDPKGRLWFGTMDDGESGASGSFYRWDDRGVSPTGLASIPITNGPALSPDGSVLYWVDTVANTMGACEVRLDGALGPSRPFLSLDPSEGHIDGPSVDSEGCVWIGLYGGWEARRYSPRGELLTSVRFPTANVTKLGFGGPDLRTVYATTARHLLKPTQIEAQPQAGHLFEFRVDVPGLACTPVAL